MKKLSILLLLTIFFGCNKDDSSTGDDPGQQTEGIEENVVVILDENSDLVSTESELARGIYVIQFNSNPPTIASGDILVGNEGKGYLRNVSSASTNGNTVTLQTTQANMDDVFTDATIQFDTGLSERPTKTGGDNNAITINYVKEGLRIQDNGLNFNFSNTVLYDEGGLSFTISEGNVMYDPNFSFSADYSLFNGLESLYFGTGGANLAIDCSVVLNAGNGVSLPPFSTTLADFDKPLTVVVAGVPVVVNIHTELVAELNAGIDTEVSLTSGFVNNYLLTTEVAYDSDGWSGDFDLDSSLTPKPVEFTGIVGINQNLTITPKVSVEFYGVVAPYCEPKMTEDFVFNVASPSLNWDANLQVGVDIKTGVVVSILGKTLADFFRTDSFEETIWNAPQDVTIFSGNNQTGSLGEPLPELLQVMVTDALGNSLSKVPVYFTVQQGGGTVELDKVMTNENGMAAVQWTLGDEAGNQVVTASVKKADGSDIAGSPIEFTATTDQLINQLKVVETGQVLDFNGLPFYYFAETDEYCNNYQIVVSFNYYNEADGVNYIDLTFSSNTSTLTDGTYALVDGECNYSVIDFYHSDLFTSVDDTGIIENGTIKISENATVFTINGELVKLDDNENETQLGLVTGRIVAE